MLVASDKQTYHLFGLYGGEWRLITSRTGRSKARADIFRALRNVKRYRARLGLPALTMKIVRG